MKWLFVNVQVKAIAQRLQLINQTIFVGYQKRKKRNKLKYNINTKGIQFAFFFGAIRYDVFQKSIEKTGVF